MARKIKNNVTIYIVDDNELDSKVLEQEFQLQTNYEVMRFDSGERFLKYIISHHISKKTIPIIILDYQLSAINIHAKNGIEVLKTIKELNRDYEVIMISGNFDGNIVTSALHHGAISFVRKNENIFLRLKNNINWIITQRELKRKKKDTILSILLFIIVMIVVSGVMLFLFTGSK